jgi:hypothetical protein
MLKLFPSAHDTISDTFERSTSAPGQTRRLDDQLPEIFVAGGSA